MSGSYNDFNYDLKCQLNVRSIRYSDLAKASGVSEPTLKRWLSVQCKPSCVEIVKTAIEKIENDRQNGFGEQYTTRLEELDSPAIQTNIELRLKLAGFNITLAAISRQLEYDYWVIPYWLSKPLTADRVAAIESAISIILDRRSICKGGR